MQDKNQIELILADRKAGKIYVLRIRLRSRLCRRHQSNTAYGQETTDEMKWNRESFIKRVFYFRHPENPTRARRTSKLWTKRSGVQSGRIFMILWNCRKTH